MHHRITCLKIPRDDQTFRKRKHGPAISKGPMAENKVAPLGHTTGFPLRTPWPCRCCRDVKSLLHCQEYILCTSTGIQNLLGHRLMPPTPKRYGGTGGYPIITTPHVIIPLESAYSSSQTRVFEITSGHTVRRTSKPVGPWLRAAGPAQGSFNPSLTILRYFYQSIR